MSIVRCPCTGLLAPVLLSAFTATAHAVPVTAVFYDFDDVGAGPFAGSGVPIALPAGQHPAVSSSVFRIESAGPTVGITGGPGGLADDRALDVTGAVTGTTALLALDVRFTAPVSLLSLEFDFFGDAGTAAPVTVVQLAVDSSTPGLLGPAILAGPSAPPGVWQSVALVPVNFAGADIFTFRFFTDSGSFGLDNLRLSFDGEPARVPEPGSLLLAVLGLGLVAAGIVGRHLRRHRSH